jgi:hypothetical protein
MTRQLRIFVQQKGRLPVDFKELSRSVDLVPSIPPNMKWVIDRTTTEIKLVKQ